MKKFFAVILAALMLAFATACANGSQNSTGTSGSLFAESKTKMFSSMQEYVDYPNTQKSIEEMKKMTLENIYELNCFAEDNAFVFEFKYKNQIPDSKMEVVKNALSKNPEDMNAILAPFMKELVEYVDVENPVIIKRYSNSDGSLITEARFDKSILENTEQETTAPSSAVDI